MSLSVRAVENQLTAWMKYQLQLRGVAFHMISGYFTVRHYPLNRSGFEWIVCTEEAEFHISTNRYRAFRIGCYRKHFTCIVRGLDNLAEKIHD